ncbi:MAG TPA: hypothetical protein VI759_08900 [Dehalococcoidia bacterium]|nr:hypothetical protein [Dehalococcoidia bacterium]
MTSSTNEPVAVVEGPNGKAEVFEIYTDGRNMEYKIVFKGKTETYKSLGEAYIEAGERAGTKT